MEIHKYAKCTHGSITKNPHSDSFACSSKTRTCRETICSIIQKKLQMWKVHMCCKEKQEKTTVNIFQPPQRISILVRLPSGSASISLKGIPRFGSAVLISIAVKAADSTPTGTKPG